MSRSVTAAAVVAVGQTAAAGLRTGVNRDEEEKKESEEKTEKREKSALLLRLRLPVTLKSLFFPVEGKEEGQTAAADNSCSSSNRAVTAGDDLSGFRRSHMSLKTDHMFGPLARSLLACVCPLTAKLGLPWPLIS